MARTQLKVSKATKERVQRRVSLANAPYVARRRNFSTSKTTSLSLVKAAVWTMV